MEIELAETKLALTEAWYENQQLRRQLQSSTSIMSDSDTVSLSSAHSTNQNSSISWLSKTVNTIKDAKNRAKN